MFYSFLTIVFYSFILFIIIIHVYIMFVVKSEKKKVDVMSVRVQQNSRFLLTY